LHTPHVLTASQKLRFAPFYLFAHPTIPTPHVYTTVPLPYSSCSMPANKFYLRLTAVVLLSWCLARTRRRSFLMNDCGIAWFKGRARLLGLATGNTATVTMPAIAPSPSALNATGNHGHTAAQHCARAFAYTHTHLPRRLPPATAFAHHAHRCLPRCLGMFTTFTPAYTLLQHNSAQRAATRAHCCRRTVCYRLLAWHSRHASAYSHFLCGCGATLHWGSPALPQRVILLRLFS